MCFQRDLDKFAELGGFICLRYETRVKFRRMSVGLSGSLLQLLARTLAGVLLFAQLVTAAHACALAAHAMPAQVAVAPSQHCHEEPGSPDPGALCARHCSADEQSPSASTPGVAPMPAIAVLVVPPLAPEQLASANGIASASDIAPATDPPPAILFHAFRS